MLWRFFSRKREKPDPESFLECTVIDALSEFADRSRSAYDIFEKAKIYAEALEYLKGEVPSLKRQELYLVRYHEMTREQTANIINPN